MNCQHPASTPVFDCCAMTYQYVTARAVSLRAARVRWPDGKLDDINELMDQSWEIFSNEGFPIPTQGKEQMFTWKSITASFPNWPDILPVVWNISISEGRCTGAGFISGQVPGGDKSSYHEGVWIYSPNEIFMQKTRIACPSTRRICMQRWDGYTTLRTTFPCLSMGLTDSIETIRVEAMSYDVLPDTPFDIGNQYKTEGMTRWGTVGSATSYPEPCSNAP
jgi:hypothetical protein